MKILSLLQIKIGAEHKEAKAILDISRSPSFVRDYFYFVGFCIQSSAPWN